MAAATILNSVYRS